MVRFSQKSFSTESVKMRKIAPLAETWGMQPETTQAHVIPGSEDPPTALARIHLTLLHSMQQLHRIREKYQINGFISASEETIFKPDGWKLSSTCLPGSADSDPES